MVGNSSIKLRRCEYVSVGMKGGVVATKILQNQSYFTHSGWQVCHGCSCSHLNRQMCASVSDAVRQSFRVFTRL